MIEYVKLWKEEPVKRHMLCQAFFDGPYSEAFSDPDQTESPDVWLPLMGDAAPEGRQQVWIIVAVESASSDDFRVKGGIVFERYRKCGDWLVTYLAVSRSAREEGVGKHLILEAEAVVKGISRGADFNVYAEAEDPTKKESEEDIKKAYKRWEILSALGMRRLKFGYIQPPLDATKNPLEDLNLLVWRPTHTSAGHTGDVSSAQLIEFLEEFYASLDASGSEKLKMMKDELRSKTEVQVERMSR